jgi:hypothetical protein
MSASPSSSIAPAFRWTASPASSSSRTAGQRRSGRRPGSPRSPSIASSPALPTRSALSAARRSSPSSPSTSIGGGKTSQDIKERAKELSSVALWLREWASDPDTWDQNLICLGDFNIDRSGSTLWQAFTSTNLTAPEQLQSPNRQVGGKPLEHFYDQIAWFTEEKNGSKPLLSLRYRPGRPVRLEPHRARRLQAHRRAEVLPDLRPLPALGRVLGSLALA